MGIIVPSAGHLAPSIAKSSSNYASVNPSTRLQFPQDHGAHPDFRIEWWYVTGQVLLQHKNQPERRQEAGIQITFFRTKLAKLANAPEQQLVFAHAALALADQGKLHHADRIGRVPYDAKYGESNCDLTLRHWSFSRDASSGRYKSQTRGSHFLLDLQFTPRSSPQLQGDKGFSQKGPLLAQASHYYSQPQMAVDGRVVTAMPKASANGKMQVDEWLINSREPNSTGSAGLNRAWLDHEWSSTLLDPKAIGWDWVGINLHDGGSIMAFRLRKSDGESLWTHWVRRDAQDRLLEQASAENSTRFMPARWWQSPRSLVKYPVACSIQFGNTRLVCTPLMDDQELDTRGSTGNLYWEGAIRVTASSGQDSGQELGRGYLELTGYGKPISL